KGIKEIGENIKTVIISGYDDFAYAKSAMDLGVTNYLLKPFLPDELFEVLEGIIEELRNQAALIRNMTELQTHFEDNVLYIQERFLKDLFLKQTGKSDFINEGKAIRLDLEANFYCTGILKIQSDSFHKKWNFSNQKVVEEFL